MARYRCTDEDGTYEKIVTATDADDAAEEWAEHAQDESAGEWCTNNSGTCVVQEIDENGQDVGGPRTFGVDVDWSPTFSAHEK